MPVYRFSTPGIAAVCQHPERLTDPIGGWSARGGHVRVRQQGGLNKFHIPLTAAFQLRDDETIWIRGVSLHVFEKKCAVDLMTITSYVWDFKDGARRFVDNIPLKQEPRICDDEGCHLNYFRRYSEYRQQVRGATTLTLDASFQDVPGSELEIHFADLHLDTER